MANLKCIPQFVGSYIQDRKTGRVESEWKKPTKEYLEYLTSWGWKLKCMQVMTRAGGICEICKVNIATETHHKSYAHLGFEPLHQLMAVCSKCHKWVHGRQVKLPKPANDNQLKLPLKKVG